MDGCGYNEHCTEMTLQFRNKTNTSDGVQSPAVLAGLVFGLLFCFWADSEPTKAGMASRVAPAEKHLQWSPLTFLSDSTLPAF